MKTWPSEDIGRGAAGPETIPVPPPAEACTDIGHDYDDDHGVEMLGRLLLWSAGLVALAAVIAPVLTR